MSQRLEGKVALITGAGTGIGAACMGLFAREGATVIGCGRRVAPLEEVLTAVQSEGGGGAVIQADLARHEEADSAVASVMEQFGRLDILVHSAGVGWSWAAVSPDSMNDIAATPPEKWREVMSINLDACYSICRAALQPMLLQGSGSIVNVSSIGGFRGADSGHTYAAAKAGMINLTRAMAVAYGAKGIRSNCVCPGLTDTPMTEEVVTGIRADPQALQNIAPMARVGTPEEMAYGCLYLASDEASYCNGVVLPIDGGTTAR